MGVARIQHIFNPLSNLPEDQMVNTWYFLKGTATDGVPITVPQATTLAGIVHMFYNTMATGGGTNIALYFAHAGMATNRETLKVYDMSDALPRAPIYTTTPTPPSANNATAPLPSEVASCLSFRGLLTSGTLAGRRRGRVYLGPLNTAAQVSALGVSRPGIGLRQAAVYNAKQLTIDADAAGFDWCVFSKTAVGDAAATAVGEVFADDAWDTQRRRGFKQTGRLLITVPI